MSSSTREFYTSVEFIYCGCNCGFTRCKYVVNNGYIRKNKLARFIDGHVSKNMSEETRKKIGLAFKGKKIS